MTIVISLQQQRVSRGLSIDEVVSLIREKHPDVRGIHHSSLHSWESETSPRSPSPDQLTAWADALGMKLLLVPARAKDAQAAA